MRDLFVYILRFLIKKKLYVIRVFEKYNEGQLTNVLQVDLEDIVVGYPPPKPNSSRKEHIFTEKDKESGDSRAQQVLKCSPGIYSYSIRTV